MFRFLILIAVFIAVFSAKAQDDVFRTEEPAKGYFDVFVPFAIVENRHESPLIWGGGFGISFTKNVFAYKPLFIGGEISYIFAGYDRIDYNADEYLANSASLTNLNLLLQLRVFRQFGYGIYPELIAGLLMPGFSSTYNYYDYALDEQISEIEKVRLFFTPNVGLGLGVKLNYFITLNFRYQLSLPVKHFHPDQVYEVGTTIYYPYIKKPINRFEIIARLTINHLM